MKEFCPYRICPLGAHVDHQNGLVTGFAIDKGIHFDYQKSADGECLLTSDDFDGEIMFNVNGLLEIKNDWGDYMRGATKILRDNFSVRFGITGKFHGELPVGGLSSSAAVTLAFLKALCKVNCIKLSNERLIDFAFWSESSFVGLSIGKLDQSCEVLCKKGHFLFLDTLDMTYKLIPENPLHSPYEFLIIYSGQARKLVNSDYNVRVDECKSAAYLTKALQNINYGKYKDTVLRDLNYDIFKKTMNSLPKKWEMRAIHFYNENERVLKGIKAWENGDMKLFGQLVRESGKSSIELYEAGSKLLIDLNNILNKTDGVYGARFMGGGFNGCCLAIIDPKVRDTVISTIKSEYESVHPEMKDNYGIYSCTSADGIGE